MAFRRDPINKEELHRLAKDRLRTKGTSGANALNIVRTQRLLEELEIRQIEMEMQNEHLSATRVQLEMALTQSAELYDFAPVGILSLDAAGAITKLNLAGARLLGGERARLLGNRLAQYLEEADRPLFAAFLERVNSAGDTRSIEVSLASQSLLDAQMQVRVSPLPQGLGWQAILTDITELKKTEALLRASDERWRLALEAAGDGVWDWHMQTGKVIFSRSFAALFGFEENQYGSTLEDWMSRIHPDDRDRVQEAVQAHLRGLTSQYVSEHRGQCKDGSWKWILSRGNVVERNREGRAVRMAGTHVDITEKRQNGDALLDAARFSQAVLDSLSAHIAVLDRHGAVVQTNAAWRKYAADNAWAGSPGFMGENYLEILGRVSGQDGEIVRTAAAAVAAVASGEVAEFKLDKPFFAPLDKHWFVIKMTPVHDVAERIVVSHEDVTDLKAAELESLKLANTDALTGALSRRNFLNLAEQELTRSTRYKLPLMVLMLDLDHFKGINDRYGHAAGDAVLQGFVKTMTGVLREMDLIGRLGGEEFAVLLPNTNLEGGQALATRIIESVRANPIAVGDACIGYTVSIGVGCLSTETTFSSLLGVADAALYRAKNSGRDRLEVAAPAP